MKTFLIYASMIGALVCAPYGGAVASDESGVSSSTSTGSGNAGKKSGQVKGPDVEQTCQTGSIQWVINKGATADVVERARKESGASKVRVLQPNQIITEEFMYGRLNLYVDESNIIIRASCF